MTRFKFITFLILIIFPCMGLSQALVPVDSVRCETIVEDSVFEVPMAVDSLTVVSIMTDSVTMQSASLDQNAVIPAEKSSLLLQKPIKDIDLRFKPVDLIAPLSLIAVGTVGYYWKGFHKLNEKVRDGMTDIRGDHYLHFDDYIQYLPVAAYLGLGFYRGGRKLDWRERIAVGVTAYIAMTAVTNVAKYSFKEKRPDSNARNSFPSGHTATVFTGAELVRKEFGWGIGGAAYAVATGVAFLRLYNGRHWLNDVIAGAGIGILSAQIGYWMLPHYRKWFHWDKKKNTQICTAMPSYSDGTLAMNVLWVF